MSEELDKTHASAVAIIPPPELWEPIQAIREKHDRHIGRWMPHINVLYPFVEKEQIDGVQSRLRAACSRVEPFELELAGFQQFHHGKGRYTMWLIPEPAGPLQQLATELAAELPELDDQFRYESGYTPHLSVGQIEGYPSVRAFLAKYRPRWRPVRFMVKELYVITREAPPDDVFRFERTVFLGPPPG